MDENAQRLQNEIKASAQNMEQALRGDMQILRGDMRTQRGEMQSMGLNLQAGQDEYEGGGRHNGGTTWRNDRTEGECKMCPARNGDG